MQDPLSSRNRRRVLVVEDENDLAEATSELLRHVGYDSGFVTTGRAAFADIDERTPDAIVLDMSLPDMDGVEFLRRLRREGASTAPVVLVTGHDGDATVHRLTIAGVKAGTTVLRKPVDAEEFLRVVGDLCAPD